MGRILMDENPTSLDLFLVKPDHELHVSSPFLQLFSLPIAIGDERLELTEGYAWRTANKHQRLFLVDVRLGLRPMRGEIKVPPRSEIHGIAWFHAELDRLLPHSGR